MNLRTEMMLAARYLKPRRNAVSIITCISILGVTLGVMVLVVVLSVMTGLTDMIKDKLLKTSPHLIITRSDGGVIEDPENVISELKNNRGQGAAAVFRPVVVQTNYRLVPRMVLGVEYSEIARYMELNLQSSEKQFPLDFRQILLGRQTAQELLVAPGGNVVLHSPDRLGRLVESADDGTVRAAKPTEFYIPPEMQVSGIFTTGNHEFDSGMVLISREDANDLYEMPLGSADMVYGWVSDPFNMDEELRNLREALREFKVESWMFTYRKVLGVLQVERNMMFFLLIFIVWVAAFSITNTLITVIHQKTREIGVLSALGASGNAIMRIFIMQGVFVGIFGALAGISGGIAAVVWRLKLMHWFSRLTGQELFPEQYYIVNELPARLVPSDLAVIALIAVFLCTLGAALPAYVASRLDPAKALRHG
ncbi:MAG: FtsX-like permease family protein [Victivallaceae bacterium]|nr:FtsX-like permease family protein [Victivallaceae bacterium]MDD4317528.1 FtsX-like permease family protein [Victivallaceae bacterium]MDD5662769.1 FtsX-like permease family protein [Victivallaceae bacterium]